MSFLIFKKTRNIPASGYCFVDPDTNYQFKGHGSLKELQEAVVLYRKNNNLEPITDLFYALQDYMCSLPINKRDGFCRSVEQLTDITYKQFVSGGKYYLSSKIKKLFGIGEANSVDHSRIEKRREMCSKCPLNVPLDESKEGFQVRKEIEDLMNKEFPHIVTKYDEDLGVCGGCDCPIKYKTCLPQQDIAKSIRDLPMSKRNNLPDGYNYKNSDDEEFVCFQRQAYDQFYTIKGQKK